MEIAAWWSGSDAGNLMPRSFVTKPVRWIVGETDGKTIGEIVRRAGGDANAVREGRVFLNRKRATEERQAVRPGDEINVSPPVPVAAAGAAAAEEIVILAREDELVAVHKPAGIPTIADHAGAAHALVARVASVLGIAEERLHPTSRLDRDVSGVVIFALSPRAAKRLMTARDEGTYARRYIALTAAAPAPDQGLWDAPIGRTKDPRHRAAFGRDAAPAQSRFATVARAGAYAMLALAPLTGRTHQLRVHAAHAGVPLLGDRIYRGAPKIVLGSGRVLGLERIMLHAARVSVPRPSGDALVIDAKVPAAMTDLWLALGGDALAWDTAIACILPDP